MYEVRIRQFHSVTVAAYRCALLRRSSSVQKRPIKETHRDDKRPTNEILIHEKRPIQRSMTETDQRDPHR